MLKTHELLAHRGRAPPAHRARPRAYEVTVPRTLFSWEITYWLSPIRGQYLWIPFYLAVLLDGYSCKVVGREMENTDLPLIPWTPG